MKKWFVVLMAVALVAAMTVPTAAEPNLSITGEYNVSGWHADGVNSQNDSTALTTADNDERDYVYQRFRVQPKFKASDNVSANLRFDFAEGIWGQDQGFSASRAAYGNGSDIQVDRAYVDVDTTWLRVRAGLQFFPVGQTQVFRDNQPGLQFNIKTGSPFGVRLGWIKVNEGGDLSDEEDAVKDTDRYLAILEWNSDTFSANVFGVAQTDSGYDPANDDYEDEPWVAGIRARADFGGFAVHGELAQFGGDNGNNVDYTGTQFNVNGMFKLGDSVKLGVDLIYSSATDDGEDKLTVMGNPFAAYDVRLGGSMGWDTMTYGRANGFLFSSTPPSGPLPGDVFDPFNTNTGAYTIGLGAMWTPAEMFSLIGQLHYMTAADDDLKNADGSDVTGEFEKGYNFLFCAIYNITPKTDLRAHYQRVDASFMDNRDPDASNLYGLTMVVKF
jgi:hypothetical protein